MHQSKNLQPLGLSTTSKTSQYWPATTLWTAHFPSWHKGKLSWIALAFPSAEYSAFVLLNIHDNPHFHYFSSLMDSTSLSIREATKQQLQYWGACCPGAPAHSHSHQSMWKLPRGIWNMARLCCNRGTFCGLVFCTQIIQQAINQLFLPIYIQLHLPFSKLFPTNLYSGKFYVWN